MYPAIIPTTVIGVVVGLVLALDSRVTRQILETSESKVVWACSLAQSGAEIGRVAVLRMIRRNAKTVNVIGGFASTLVGAIWSFVIADRLNTEMRHLSDLRAFISNSIEKLEAAASQYFIMNQQGDLIFILGHQPNAEAQLAATMYRGNLLDREIPIRNMIAALAIARQVDYRKQNDEYVALEKKAADSLSFQVYQDLKQLEKDIVQRAQKLADEDQSQLFAVLRQISSNEASQTIARIVGLVFTILGTLLLLMANLVTASGMWSDNPPLMDSKPKP